jgi:serine/threonine-protein kinase ATR
MMQGKATTQPLPERKRSIAAIGELISLARHNVKRALPQVLCFHSFCYTY